MSTFLVTLCFHLLLERSVEIALKGTRLETTCKFGAS